MSLDIIKEYLVGIGFQIDTNSLKTAEEGISSAGKTINDFNNSNNKGFSESGDSMKDFFSVLGLISGSVGKLFPSLNAPFKNIIKDITTIKNLYNDLSKEKVIKVKQETQETTSPPKTKNTPPNANSSNSTQLAVSPSSTELSTPNLIDTVLQAQDASKALAEQGVTALETFSTGAITAMAATVTAVIGFIVVTKKLIDSIADLAKKDIEYEKLSRQLWTTKENAKEVSMALETMGVTMKDLWLSPTLMKQFTQLRKDSAALKLPKEYTDNLKVVQGVGLEFKRLKQFGDLGFQWFANDILKDIIGPLSDFTKSFHSFNNWLSKNIPQVSQAFHLYTKAIGNEILLLLGPIGQLFSVFSLLRNIKPAETNKSDSKDKTIELLAKVKAKFNQVKNYIGNGMNWLKNGWDYYYNKAAAILQKIAKIAKETWKDITTPFDKMGEAWDNAKKNIGDIAVKVQGFSESSATNSVPASYATTNTNSNSTTTANSNNKVENSNIFKIYGSSDPTSTAKSTANTLTGITQRNLQGVY